MSRVLVVTMADGVMAMPGQKFFVLGGGFDNLHAASFPAVFTRISLLLALEIEAGSDVKVVCRVVLRPKNEGAEILNITMNFTRNGNFDHPTVAWQGLNLPPLSLAGPGPLILEAACGDSRFASQFEVIGPPTPIFPAPGNGTSFN